MDCSPCRRSVSVVRTTPVAKRIAVVMSLTVFVACLFIGGFDAKNTFGTTVWRALLAMAGTLVIGLVVGVAAEKMLDENLKDQEKKLQKK